jgi:beta-lactamase class A
MYRWKKMIQTWVISHKKQLLVGLGAFLVLLVIGQLAYPGSHLLPFTRIDNVAVGGWQKKDVVTELDKRYAVAHMDVYFGEAETAYRSPKPADIKLQVNNQNRIEAISYPWYLRLLPGSLLWANLITKPSQDPQYTYSASAIKSYVDRELGSSCSVQPKNASFKANGNKLEVVRSHDGGTCEVSMVISKLSSVKPKITDTNKVTIPVKVIKPAITNDTASNLVKQLTAKLGSGVTITAGSATRTIAAADVFSWLDVSEQDGKLIYAFNSDRAGVYLNQQIAPNVTVKPGVSKVTTYDFVETARQDGQSGQTLDIVGTLAQLKEYTDSKRTSVSAVTKSVAPTVEYTRSYSATDTGMSALLKNYAESHPGTFGVSLIELSGKHRRASYQDDKSFTTASTYKLFVAYSALKRVEEGSWQWSDQIQGGRNLEKCFDDMIVRSDNACAEAMLQKISYKSITSEIQALGLKNTTFLKGDTPLTTAGDLSLFNAMLQSGQILTQQASRDRLLGAMKRNIYRQGIPAGTSSQAADKVGFLDGLLHDAAIVYSPTGPYVLTIMTDGSSWATIADLTRQIESLQNQ